MRSRATVKITEAIDGYVVTLLEGAPYHEQHVPQVVTSYAELDRKLRKLLYVPAPEATP